MPTLFDRNVDSTVPLLNYTYGLYCTEKLNEANNNQIDFFRLPRIILRAKIELDQNPTAKLEDIASRVIDFETSKQSIRAHAESESAFISTWKTYKQYISPTLHTITACLYLNPGSQGMAIAANRMNLFANLGDVIFASIDEPDVNTAFGVEKKEIAELAGRYLANEMCKDKKFNMVMKQNSAKNPNLLGFELDPTVDSLLEVTFKDNDNLTAIFRTEAKKALSAQTTLFEQNASLTTLKGAVNEQVDTLPEYFEIINQLRADLSKLVQNQAEANALLVKQVELKAVRERATNIIEGIHNGFKLTQLFMAKVLDQEEAAQAFEVGTTMLVNIAAATVVFLSSAASPLGAVTLCYAVVSNIAHAVEYFSNSGVSMQTEILAYLRMILQEVVNTHQTVIHGITYLSERQTEILRLLSLLRDDINDVKIELGDIKGKLSAIETLLRQDNEQVLEDERKQCRDDFFVKIDKFRVTSTAVKLDDEKCKDLTDAYNYSLRTASKRAFSGRAMHLASDALLKAITHKDLFLIFGLWRQLLIHTNKKAGIDFIDLPNPQEWARGALWFIVLRNQYYNIKNEQLDRFLLDLINRGNQLKNAVAYLARKQNIQSFTIQAKTHIQNFKIQCMMFLEKEINTLKKSLKIDDAVLARGFIYPTIKRVFSIQHNARNDLYARLNQELTKLSYTEFYFMKEGAQPNQFDIFVIEQQQANPFHIAQQLGLISVTKTTQKGSPQQTHGGLIDAPLLEIKFLKGRMKGYHFLLLQQIYRNNRLIPIHCDMYEYSPTWRRNQWLQEDKDLLAQIFPAAVKNIVPYGYERRINFIDFLYYAIDDYLSYECQAIYNHLLEYALKLPIINDIKLTEVLLQGSYFLNQGCQNSINNAIHAVQLDSANFIVPLLLNQIKDILSTPFTKDITIADKSYPYIPSGGHTYGNLLKYIDTSLDKQIELYFSEYEQSVGDISPEASLPIITDVLSQLNMLAFLLKKRSQFVFSEKKNGEDRTAPLDNKQTISKEETTPVTAASSIINKTFSTEPSQAKWPSFWKVAGVTAVVGLAAYTYKKNKS